MPTEIHGYNAEYILANPNGITCKGCGFINTPRTSLITGTSRMNNGDIEGFDISSHGDIIINGNNNNLQTGLNVWDTDSTNNVDSFDIATRVAKINARIYAKNLTIKTGNDYYNYKTKEIISQDLPENKPTVAIDSSALGGMYAGRIIMESTESGVGVNLGDNVIADTNELTITADGQIQYTNLASQESTTIQGTEVISDSTDKIISNKEIQITSSNNYNTNGEIQAKENISINSNGEINIEGDIRTDKDLSITSQNGNITNKTNFHHQETINNIDTQISNIKGKTTITTNGGDFSNGYIIDDSLDSSMQSAMVYDLFSDNGIDITAKNITNNGTIQTGGDLNFTATQDFNNISNLKADGGSDLQTNNALLLSIGNTNIYANNITNKAGEILSFGDINLAKDSSLGNATKIENLSAKIGSHNTANNYISATIDANEDININALTLNNTGYNYDLDDSGFFGYNVNDLVYQGGYGNGYYNLMNQDEATSTLQTRKSFITAGNDININNANFTNSSSSVSAGNDINITGGSLNNIHNTVNATGLDRIYGKYWTKRHRHGFRKKTHHYYHQYNAPYTEAVYSADAPSIIAGGSLNINGVSSVTNGVPDYLINLQSENTQTISSLETAKTDLETDLTAGQTKEAEITAEIDAITTIPTATKPVIDGYLTNTNEAITELNTQKTELETQITVKLTEVNAETDATLKANLQTELDTLNAEKTETDGFITEQSSVQATLEGKITEITTKQNEISQLTTDKQDATNLITQKTSSKTTIETNLTNAQTQLQDVNDQLVGGSTQALLDQKDTLQTEIDGYNSDITTLNSEITTQQTLETSLTNQISTKQSEETTLLTNTQSNYITTQGITDTTELQEELTAQQTINTELQTAITKNNDLITQAQTKKTEIETAIANPSSGAVNSSKAYDNTSNSTGQNFNFSSLFTQANADSKYLLETNSQYISTDALRGSFYFLDRIGYNPDQDVKIAFDPFMEAKIIQRQIQEQTGKRYLKEGIASNTDQLEDLYNNSFEEYNRLQQDGIELKTGIKLTNEQVQALQKDIIWLEQETITLPDGTQKEALVSKLYLANFDTESLSKALLRGNNVSIASDGNITNYGNIKSTNDLILDSKTDILNAMGLISSDGNQTLTAQNDITNNGGTLTSKGNLSLNAGGNINNLNIKKTKGDTRYNTQTQEYIAENGEMLSGGEMSLASGNNINFIGTSATAIGSISLASQNQINILTETLNSSLNAQTMLGKSSSSRKEVVTTNIGSALKSGGDFISSSVGNTNIHGSRISADGSGNMESLAGDINITNAIDSKMTHTIDKKKGTFSSSYDEVYDYKETAVESGLDFGKNLDIIAENGDFTLQGSSIKTDGDLSIGKFTIATNSDGSYKTNADGTYQTVSGGAVENVNIKSAELRNEHNEIHKKTKFNPIGMLATYVGGMLDVVSFGAFSKATDGALNKVAGSAYEKSTVKTFSKETTLVSSNIDARDLNINANENINIEASNVSATGLAKLNANEIIVTSKTETKETSKSEKTIKLGETDVGFRESSFNMAIKGSGEESKNVIKTGTQKSSNLNFGSLLMNSKDDTTITASNVGVTGDAVVKTGGDFKLLDAKDTVDSKDEQSKLEVEVGVKVSNAYVDAGFAVKAQLDAINVLEKSKKKLDKIKDLKSKGMASQKAVDLAYTQVALATAGVATANLNLTMAIAGAASAAATSAGTGMAVAGYMNTTASTNFTDTEQESSVGSSFVTGGNVSIASDKNLDMIGSILASNGGDVDVSADEINIKAGESSFVQESGFKTTNVGVSVGNAGVQLSAGHSQGENNIIQTTHQNSQILAENGSFTLNSKKDTNIIGGNIEANKVDVNVGGDLKVETVQDTYEEIGSSFGVNIGGSAGGNNKDSGGVSNVGFNMSAKDIFSKTTGEKSGIVSTSSYNNSLSDSENLVNLLGGNSVNVAGGMENLTEKKDTQFINADFEGGLSVPTAIFTKKGRAGIKDAYGNVISNTGIALVGAVENIIDPIIAVGKSAVGNDKQSPIKNWKGMRKDSAKGHKTYISNRHKRQELTKEGYDKVRGVKTTERLKKKHGFVKLEDEKSLYHTYKLDKNGKPINIISGEQKGYLKYINTKEGYEVVVKVDENKNILSLVEGPVNTGTYNHYSPNGVKNNIKHTIFDVVPYFFHGNDEKILPNQSTPTDPTWATDRVLRTFHKPKNPDK